MASHVPRLEAGHKRSQLHDLQFRIASDAERALQRRSGGVRGDYARAVYDERRAPQPHRRGNDTRQGVAS